MLLLLTTTHRPATDLGFLLRKHPDNVHEASLTFGRAYVFWPEATEERATAALYVDIDPVALSRRTHAADPRPLEPYVNDRPYVASSFLSVALNQVFRSALAGSAPERPLLADTALPLQIVLPAVRARGGERAVRELFEPLGYTVIVAPTEDPSVLSVTLDIVRPVHEVLGQLYVLMPVLDDVKHYWVGEDEVDKLLRHGAGWLEDHPARDRIASGYLKHQRTLFRAALAQLAVDEAPPTDAADDAVEEAIEKKETLVERRIRFVRDQTQALGARQVIDLGCGEGRLVKRLLAMPTVEKVVGIDVSARSLAIARDRIDPDRLPQSQADKLVLLEGSVLYRDDRTMGFDLATCIEVVEHIEPDRLGAFEDAVFAHARPSAVILTTPNREHNIRFEGLKEGRFRHHDHRFEWTRSEFSAWANAVAVRNGYSVTLHPIGEEDPTLGPPTQAAVFRRGESA